MRYSLAALLCCVSFPNFANVLQYFTGITYSNPAELFTVKKNEFIVGGTGFYVDARYTGTALNFNTFQYNEGVSDSKRISFLPYGRIATRINDKVVFGVDITQPFHSNLEWGRSAVTRYAATETLMRDIDVSPRLGAALLPKLYAGAGLNFNFLKNNETNWALPANQFQYATLVNKTSGFGVGFDAGLYFMANQTNFFGVSYYSAIRQNTQGESLFDSSVNNNIYFNFHFPATYIFNYVHLFSPSWLMSLKAFRSEWDINQYARIYNTAARQPVPDDFIFTMKYRSSWAYNAAMRHQINEKLGLTLIGVMDMGPERDHLRTINFPSDTQYFLALSADYHLTKKTTIELLYGRGYSKTLINNQITNNNQIIPFNSGRVNIHADVLDLKIKIQM